MGAAFGIITSVLVIFTTGLDSRSTASQARDVRLALVNVPDELLRPLLPVFHQQTGVSASIVYTGNDPYGAAREGKADLVISHFGHPDVEPFVRDGLGLWPQAVFSNQMALIGPPNDPARVRGLRSLSQAMRQIAETKSRYVVNRSAGATYLENIATVGIDNVASAAWYLQGTLQNAEAVQAAAKSGAYVLWGVPPFLRLKRQQALNLEPLVTDDPMLQRMMVSVVVNQHKVQGVNASTAKVFQQFLLDASTQARIAAFRYPDFDRQVWWPAGRHNSARD